MAPEDSPASERPSSSRFENPELVHRDRPSATKKVSAPLAEPRIRLAAAQLGAEEASAVEAVLRSGVLTNGPKTQEFERVFAQRHGVRHAVAMANGTVALTAACLALGIGRGDEVIVPSLTFVSSATSIVHAGATPIFADVEAASFNIDPRDVERKLTSRTKAVVAVHYGGQPADMDELSFIANERNLVIIEDAAHAHGGVYRERSVGGLGAAAMFSFTPTKNITTGEGGMVTTNNDEIASRLRLLRNHGQDRLYSHAMLGYNWRITEMQAAIGVVQVGKLDSVLERKRTIAAWIAQRLAGVEGLSTPQALVDRSHSFMLYTLKIPGRRDRVLRALLNAGIEARVYFPPIHLQPVFATTRRPHLPVTERLAEEILTIPSHARLTTDELGIITEAVLRAL